MSPHLNIFDTDFTQLIRENVSVQARLKLDAHSLTGRCNAITAIFLSCWGFHVQICSEDYPISIL